MEDDTEAILWIDTRHMDAKRVRAKTLKFCSRYVNSKISVDIYTYMDMYTEHRKRVRQIEK